MYIFTWDEDKNYFNIRKHGISFYEAQEAFFDNQRVITLDTKHTTNSETRYFCFGKINEMIATVRFTIRDNQIRIFGAGYWREGKKRYEEDTNV